MAIAAEAVKLGIPVLRPMTEGLRYDLALELRGRIARVQCKWAVRKGEVVTVCTQTSRRTRDGFRRTTYTADEIDYIAAWCPDLDDCYLLPISLAGGQTIVTLRLSPPRNGQRAGLHFGRDYLLGAVAQLAERRHGMAEARGSNPLSSTPTPEDAEPTLIGAHEFRNRFGWYMERAAAGEPIVVTHRGRPHLRLSSAVVQPCLAA